MKMESWRSKRLMNIFENKNIAEKKSWKRKLLRDKFEDFI
jgi:hypothetical protein